MAFLFKGNTMDDLFNYVGSILAAVWMSYPGLKGGNLTHFWGAKIAGEEEEEKGEEIQ